MEFDNVIFIEKIVQFYVIQYVCDSNVSCKYGNHINGEKIPQ